MGEPGIRNPRNREETIPVQRDEPINAVIVAGTNELGDGFFIPNPLVSSPLADRGIDEFIVTADIDFFEGYGLGGNDIWRFRNNIASVFASGDDGNDFLSAATNVRGSEVAFTGGAGRDRIRASAPWAASVVAIGGDGNDSIDVDARRASTIFVTGGDGSDLIVVDARGAASLVALGGRGRDTLFIRLGTVMTPWPSST